MDTIITEGLEALEQGKLRVARNAFESACKLEEKEGKKPEDNSEIRYLLYNILVLESLARMEKDKPEAFARMEACLCTGAA